MINERYVKKSPNISPFYSWSDVSIEGAWASSHQYLWQGLTCLWSPLKPFQKKPRPFCSPGTNMLQYIILESSQATWNAESEVFEGEGGGFKFHIGGFSAAYLLGEIFSCLSFFLTTWLHWLIRFYVCAQSAHSCSVTMDTAPHTKPAYVTPMRWKHSFT